MDGKVHKMAGLRAIKENTFGMEKAAPIKRNSEFPSRHRVLKIISAEFYAPLSQHLPAASKINSSVWWNCSHT